MSTDYSLRRSRRAAVQGSRRNPDRQVRGRTKTHLEVLALERRELLSGTGPYYFDFGTSSSPVASGYTKVTESTQFSAASGYGWQSGSIASRDRGTPAAPDRDFDYTSNGNFAVNLANGTYDVTLISGDSGYAHSNEGFFLQGTQVATIATKAGQFATNTYQATVKNGQLVLGLQSVNGPNNSVVINAMQIQLISPNVSATAAGPVNAGQAESFSSTVSGGTAPYSNYTWAFGDGGKATGTTSPTYTYANPGTYTATLTVTDAAGLTGTGSAVVTVNDVPPTVSFSTSAKTGQSGVPISFSASAQDVSPAVQAAGYTFNWNFGDGSTATGATPSHAYAAGGTYQVTVTATDEYGNSGTATGSLTVTNTMATTYTLAAPNPADCATGTPSCQFTVGLPWAQYLSQPVTVTPSDGKMGGTFTPASVVLSNANPTATFTYTAATTGTITIAARNNGGLTNPAPVTITAQSPVTTYTVAGPSSGTVATGARFTISLGSGWLANPVQVAMAASNGDGTFSPSSVTLNMANPSATITYTPQLYGPRNITFSNNGGLVDATPLAFLSEVQVGSSGTAPSGNQAPDLGGFDFFTNGAWWQAIGSPASNYSVAPNSAQLLSGFGSGGMRIDFSTTTANGGDSLYGIAYNVVPGTQPMVPVEVYEYPSQSDSKTAPFYSGMTVESIPPGTTPPDPATADQHGLVMVRNETTGGIAYLYEGYGVGIDTSDGSWAAKQLSVFNLTTGQPRPEFWTSSDAAGLPVSPLLVNYSEAALAAAGGPAIDHPFRICISPALSMNAFVWPARHGVYSGSPTTGLPMGARLQLSQSWYNANINSFDPIDRAIVTAMYQYGLIVADLAGGGMWLEGTNDQRFTTSELHALGNIPVSAFQVLNTIQAPVSMTGNASGPVGTAQTITVSYLNNADSNFASSIYVDESTNGGTTWKGAAHFIVSDSSRGPFTFTFTPSAAGTYMFRINYGGNDWILPPVYTFTATSTPTVRTATTTQAATGGPAAVAMMALPIGDAGSATTAPGAAANTAPQPSTGGGSVVAARSPKSAPAPAPSNAIAPVLAAPSARPAQAATVPGASQRPSLLSGSMAASPLAPPLNDPKDRA
jgi:PKD repeat protein